MGKSGMSLYVYTLHMVVMETVMFTCKMEFPGEGGYGIFLSGVVVLVTLIVAFVVTKIQTSRKNVERVSWENKKEH